MIELSDGDESDIKVDADDEEQPDVPKKKAAKKAQKKEPAKKKAGEKELLNPNLVKANNKLVGDLEQGGLYSSDEGGPRQDLEMLATTNTDDKLDLGQKAQAPKITTSSFLAKLKKQAPDQKDDLSAQI